MKTSTALIAIVSTVGAASAFARVPVAAQEKPAGQGFAFHTSVDLVNVAVTVTDANGRFVPNLRREDFVVLEDGKPQPISQFDSERVPVSLGLALDTSGSMAGAKIQAAQSALHRFLFDLLDPKDEAFLYRFDSRPQLVEGWSTDRGAITRGLGAIKPNGGTAIYDTIAEAIPLMQSGTLRKKALVLISDGQDTSSHMRLDEVRDLIRESEVLVYAVGIDDEGRLGSTTAAASSSSSSPGSRSSRPVPSPFPGKAPPPSSSSSSASSSASSNTRASTSGCGGASNGKDRVSADTLRQLTDDSGGRTEIICTQRDLDPATASIADELRRQYFIAYRSAAPKDGRWHTIDVQVNKGPFHIRARRGFISEK